MVELTLRRRFWQVPTTARCPVRWTHCLVPSFSTLGETKTRHCVKISFLCAQGFHHAAKRHRVRPAIDRALPIEIAEVANGIRRMGGCDVQFVPVR